MATQFLPKPINSFLGKVDQILHERGIHCGMPRGANECRIITKNEKLAVILKGMNPGAYSDGNDDFAEATDNEWVAHRAWQTSREWKGSFWEVLVFKNSQTGRCRLVLKEYQPWLRRFNFMIETIGRRAMYCDVSAELTARRRLFQELAQHQQDAYTVSDAFIEIGRSGIRYILRKNRPTIAIRRAQDGTERVLCALCMHPVAYYDETWAGTLPPSDEVLSHLLMIRANEKLYWRKSNQIPPEKVNSGV